MTCEIKWCLADVPQLVSANEIIGDGSYAVQICPACADMFGATLPDSETVEKKVRARHYRENWLKTARSYPL